MRDSDQHPFKGPFHFNGKDVFFDEKRNEFWDPAERVYLDHEVGLHLIDLYFGHQKHLWVFLSKLPEFQQFFTEYSRFYNYRLYFLYVYLSSIGSLSLRFGFVITLKMI